MLKIFVISCLLASSAFLEAAVSSPPVQMTIQKGEQPIQLQGLTINTDISGSMALTRVRMVFFNPNKRALEGELQFPLLEGQEIIAFALDIDGVMRAAVPVEKVKGRQIFEDIERRSADPALLEKTQGNNFKLRVYPINSMNTRTVELTYSEPLVHSNGELHYRLPLGYETKLKEFDFTLSAHGVESAPKVSGAMGSIPIEKKGDKYVAHIQKNNVSAQGEITFSIPFTRAPKTFTQTMSDTTYFMSEIPVSLSTEVRSLPKILGLLWDASGSGATRALDAELSVLDQYFKTIKNLEVRLTRLRDQHEAIKIYQIVNGNWDGLRTELQATVYDGATNLNDWQPQADVNEYLLFSDGLANYGSAMFPVLSSTQSLFSLSSSLGADAARLTSIAENSHGRFIRIAPNKANLAAESLLRSGIELKVLRSAGVTDVVIDKSHLNEGLIRVAGKMTSPTAAVDIALLERKTAKEIHLSVAANSPSNPLAAYLWASNKLRQLEGDYELHRAEIRRLGIEFSIPTRETSLLVLDTIEDYVKYDVTPPANLQVAFAKLKTGNRSAQQLTRQKQIDQLVIEFEKKVAWWEKTYPKRPVPNPAKKGIRPLVAGQRTAVHSESVEEVVVSGLHSVGRPAPAPAPAASRVVESVSAEDAGHLSDVSVAEPLQRVVAESKSEKEAAGDRKQQNGTNKNVSIALKKWTSDAPYIARMNAATKETIYKIYLDEKPSYINSSAFYLDVADALFEKELPELAKRVLSNLAEMDLENTPILRILGYRLMQVNAPELALPVFEKVLVLAPDEPQSYRDLGLVYAELKQYQKAIDQFNQVIERSWDGRFADIELITLAELNAVIAEAHRVKVALDVSKIDSRLQKNLPLDVRAVLTWDANDSDMDLWVTDPNNEKCFYGHKNTLQGGLMSRDFTQGYGPEEFSLRDAKPGKYKVEANFFGNRQQIVAGATTLQMKLTTAFGTKDAKNETITLRLKDKGETVFVGEFEVKPK
ncbi:MAG: tetratricopeptide repeat protein [Pseudomonadota bacterium]